MAGTLTTEALFKASFLNKDQELSQEARRELLKRFGITACETVWQAAGQNSDTGKVVQNVLSLPIPCPAQSELLGAVFGIAGKDPASLGMDVILDLYHDGDSEHRKKATTYVVAAYEDYIYSVIMERYPSYIGMRDDLFQSGVVGLIRALGLYDRKRGVSSFLTYARTSILHEIQGQIYLMEGTTANYAGRNKKIDEAINELSMIGEKVTVDRVAEIAGCEKRTVNRAMRIKRNRTMVSLDEEVCGTSRIEMVSAEDGTPSTEEIALDHIQAEEVHKAFRKSICKIGEKQRKALKLFFFDGKNLREVAEALGVCRTSARNYIEEALETLKKDGSLQAAYLGEVVEEEIGKDNIIFFEGGNEEVPDFMEVMEGNNGMSLTA